jgi:hypothetical protein
LNWIQASNDFALVTDFVFSSGLRAYLFGKKSFGSVKVNGISNGWITSAGLSLQAQRSQLTERPFIILAGPANYKWLGSVPQAKAFALDEAGKRTTELPVSLKAEDYRYELVIDARAVAKQTGDAVKIELVFDRFFVPAKIGINEDSRELVMLAPTKREMVSSPP